MVKALVGLVVVLGGLLGGSVLVAIVAIVGAAGGAGSPTRVPVGDYALPVPVEIIDANPGLLSRPHHDYSAWDVGLTVGPLVTAMAAGTVTFTAADQGRCGGTVVIAGVDDAAYTYCHLSAVLVSHGQKVPAGALVALSGGLPGAPGAGNTTGPHLHLGITVDGRAVCPQPLLEAIWRSRPVDVRGAPSVGCFY